MNDDDNRDAPPNDGDATFVRLFDGATPRDELERIIARYTQESVEALREQLDGDEDLTPAERARLVAFAEPVIRQQTRATFEAAHRRLQH